MKYHARLVRPRAARETIRDHLPVFDVMSATPQRSMKVRPVRTDIDDFPSQRQRNNPGLSGRGHRCRHLVQYSKQ
jgi:hypothetical protein